MKSSPLINPVCWVCRRLCIREVSIYGPNFTGKIHKLIGVLGAGLGIDEEIIKEATETFLKIVPIGSLHQKSTPGRIVIALLALFDALKKRKEYESLTLEEFLENLPRPPCKSFGWATAHELQRYYKRHFENKH